MIDGAHVEDPGQRGHRDTRGQGRRGRASKDGNGGEIDPGGEVDGLPRRDDLEGVHVGGSV